jgi:antirestriction protein ArdC
MICGLTGISPATVDNSAEYLKNWLARLRGDSKLIFTAASAAQRAADYLRGISAKSSGEAEEASAGEMETVPEGELVAA